MSHDICHRFRASGHLFGSLAAQSAGRDARLDRVAVGAGEAGNRQPVGNAAGAADLFDGVQTPGRFQHESACAVSATMKLL